MKLRGSSLGLSVFLIGIALAFSHGAMAGSTKESRSWAQKMRNLEVSLQELLVDVSSDERFNSPKNFKRIESNAQKLLHFLPVLIPNSL